MDKDLAAIKDKWESRPAAGSASSDPNGAELRGDDDTVYKLADKYVAAHPDDFAGLDKLSLELVVKLLEESRDKGDEAGAWKYQTWLFHHFEPQNIGGTHEATIRQAG